MQKLLEIVLWVLIGVCFTVTSYNVLERDKLMNHIDSIQTAQNVIQEQQRDILKLLE